MEPAAIIAAVGALLAAALAMSLVARRVRLPALLLLLVLGMAIGSDGADLISFSDYRLAQDIGVGALALILFEGGLTAGWRDIKPVALPAGVLATAGTLLATLLTGLAAQWLFGLSLLEGLLLGAIISSTDGAAIFSLLRGSTLRRRLARTLEGESGFNDPVAVLLVVGFADWIRLPDYGAGDLVVAFAEKLLIGGALGAAIGLVAVPALRRARLDSPGLYPVASLAVAALAFGVPELLHGSGFLGVYAAGLVLGSGAIPARRTITAFHEGLAWVAQLVLFLTLGLLVFPSRLDDVAVEGTVLALIAVVVARPAAVLLTAWPFGFSVRDRLVLGWAGLRGAVPIVLATFPVVDGLAGSEATFNIVFFAVLISTLLQATTFEAFAKRLGATTAEPALPRPLADAGTIRRLGAEVLDYPVKPGDAIVGARVRDLGLPRDGMVSVIVREGEALPPRGSMRVLEGDRLHLMVREDAARDLPQLLDRWERGPVTVPERPRPVARSRPPVFSVRPWRDEDGDPARPAQVGDRPVAAVLRVRRDRPGALVALATGDVAVTGPLLASGPPRAVGAWARQRLRAAASEGDRAWWEEVAGELAA
ncbi:MAG: potassium/proton antiporter [Solirubrobacteraceae bacterium]